MITAQRWAQCHLPGDAVAIVHAAFGDGCARVVSRPAFVGAAVGAGDGVVHGVSSSGLFVAGTPDVSGIDDIVARIVGHVLENATMLDGAVALAKRRLADIAEPRAELLLAQGAEAVTVRRDVDVEARVESRPLEHAEGMETLLSSIRDHERDGLGSEIEAGSWCRHAAGARTVSVIAARVSAAHPATILLAPGPPCCGVFLRYWPGTEVGPDAADSATQRPRVARLARDLGDVVAAQSDLLDSVRRRLSTAETEALAEGDDADRMATLMDADGDDRGAEVRRVVAQAYALDIAVRAMSDALDEGLARGTNL